MQPPLTFGPDRIGIVHIIGPEQGFTVCMAFISEEVVLILPRRSSPARLASVVIPILQVSELRISWFIIPQSPILTDVSPAHFFSPRRFRFDRLRNWHVRS